MTKELEKKTQELLAKEFDGELCYQIKTEPMKTVCSKCSIKDTNNPGYPDAWFIANEQNGYNDQNILIVFECKSDDLDAAIKQLKIYQKKMIELDQFDRVYFVAYSGTTIKKREFYVFDNEFEQLEIPEIKLIHFGLTKVFIKPDVRTEMKTMIHHIHDLIRDRTKLSNEDKPLFIGSILLGIQIPSYKELISDDELDDEKLNGEELSQILIDKIDKKYKDHDITNSIQFLKKTLDNKILFEISQKTLSVYKQVSKDKSIDVLGLFYTEFCRYQNTDSSSLGIVLTPDHIVKMMIELLELNEDDVFLDLCTGTGSFLKEAAKTCQVVGCEYQNKLASLAKINMIIVGNKENVVYHNDCFKQDFSQYKFTKSAINPPYGVKNGPKEIEFIDKQLELLEDGGLCCAIVPENIFNKSCSKQKKNIFENSKILRIIKCNPKLFVPVASVQTCIILLKKCKPKKNYQTCLQDYTEEKFIEREVGSRKKIYLQEAEFEQQYKMIIDKDEELCECRVLTNKEDWKQTQKPMQFEEILNKLAQQRIDQKTKEIQNQIMEEQSKMIQKLEMKPKQVKISDLFEYVGHGKRVKNIQEGQYPFIAASKFNNGIVKYVDQFNYDGVYLSVAYDGSVGQCFIQQGKFFAADQVILLKYKSEVTVQQYQQLANYMTVQFSQKYDYTNKLHKERLMNETIQLPSDEYTKQFEIINNHFDALFQIRTIQIQKEYFNESQMNKLIQGYTYKISDLFEYQTPKKTYDLNKEPEGEYPLISASKENNGIMEYIDKYTFDGQFITVSGFGSSGYCFVQQGKFAVRGHGSILILKPKLKFGDNLIKLSQFMTAQFSQKYKFSNALTKERLMNETIQLPWLLEFDTPIKLEDLSKEQLLEFIEDEEIGPIKKPEAKTKEHLIEYILGVYTFEDSDEINEKLLYNDLKKFVEKDK